MSKKYTKIILIVSIFITIIVVGLFVFFFDVIKNKNEHTSKVILTLVEKIEDRENREILIGKVAELESINETIDEYFVDPKTIDTFVDYLEKLGIQNDTELVIENVEAVPKKKNEISVKVSIKGDFDHVMRVVYLLENIPYYVNLNQAYVNKEVKTTSVETEEGEKEEVSTFWQADVSFNVLNIEEKKDD
jgi:hypothetical protein